MKKGIYCSIANALENDRVGGEEDDHKLFGKALTDELRTLTYGIPTAKEFVIISGDREIFPRDKIFHKQFGSKIIPNTDHEFTDAYKQAVFMELGI